MRDPASFVSYFGISGRLWGSIVSFLSKKTSTKHFYSSDTIFDYFDFQHLMINGIIQRVDELLRRLTRKPKVRMAVGSNTALDSWSLSVTLARVDQSNVREIW